MEIVKTKILLISPFATSLLYGGHESGPGGAERQMVLIANLLTELKTNVYFCCQPQLNLQSQDNPKIKLIFNKFRYLGKSKFYLIIDGFYLLFQIFKIRPNYILIRNGGPLVLFWLFISRFLFKCKLILSIQNDRDIDPSLVSLGLKPLITKIYQKMVKYFDIIICQHKRQSELILSNYKKKSIIIPNISARIWNIEINQNKEKTIYWAGNTTKNKRFEIVLEIAKLLPNYKFIIAMNSSNESMLNQYKMLSQNIPNIKFLGSISPRESELLYFKTSLVLNTSVFEGYPNSLLQAWEASTPVVTAGVNPSNIITSNNLGEVVLIENNNKEQIKVLAKTIENILNNDVDYNNYINSINNYMAKNHFYNKIVNLYKEIFQL